MHAERPAVFLPCRGRIAQGLAVSLISALPGLALAQQGAGPGLPLVVAQGAAGTSYSVPIQTLLFFTALSFLPALALGPIVQGLSNQLF